MTEQEMLEAEKHWCENCCNFDKEGMCHDGYSTCKVTNMLAYSECCGKECKFFDVPAENVIVPPCKVGDMVYVKYYGEIVNAYVTEFEINSRGIVAKVYIDPDTDREYDAEDLFLTKEEAEQNLKGGAE